MLINVACIILSAVLYAHALILWPFSWAIFIFLIPLFHVAQQHKLSFAYGLLWGFVFYVIHLLSIIHWVSDTYSYGILLGLSFAAYLALTPAVWFWGTNRLLLSPYIWPVSFFFYFLMHCKLQCLIFPSGYEYWLSLPMISFATTGWGVSCLYWLGSYGSLVLIVIINFLVYTFVAQRALHSLLATIIALIFLILGLWHIKPISIRPSWLNQLGYVSPTHIHGNSVHDKAFSMREQLARCANSNVDTILMPESTLKIPLNQYPEVLAWWSQACPQRIILGAHRQESSGSLFNSLFIIKDGLIVDTYDKNHPMPFIEFVPPSASKLPLKNSLFKEKEEFSFGNKEHSLLLASQKFTTQICSDFYMTHNNHLYPIVLFLNDYYSIPYSPSLFWHGALYKAVTSKKGLLYVGHYGANWVSMEGEFYSMMS
ncbi:MAG TPA: hypothetical protein QGF02_03150 [Candidatus Babeliales bacterium]|nr:hypothetical protein [Candidatus Babeliales bacterium]